MIPFDPRKRNEYINKRGKPVSFLISDCNEKRLKLEDAMVTLCRTKCVQDRSVEYFDAFRRLWEDQGKIRNPYERGCVYAYHMRHVFFQGYPKNCFASSTNILEARSFEEIIESIREVFDEVEFRLVFHAETEAGREKMKEVSTIGDVWFSWERLMEDPYEEFVKLSPAIYPYLTEQENLQTTIRSWT